MRSCRPLFCRALPAQLLIFLCLAAHFDTFITGAHADDGCSSPHFEYMLSTASFAVQSCFSYDIGIPDVLVCPAGTSTGTMLAIASIIACSDLRVDTYTPHRIPCDVAVCACTDEDDLDCIDCREGATSGFPCFTVPLEGANRHSCLKLAAQVPLSSLSRQITTIGQYSHAHDRFIFKIPSSFNHDASIINHSTPSLGPWTLGPLHRWRLSHALDDDKFVRVGLEVPTHDFGRCMACCPLLRRQQRCILLVRNPSIVQLLLHPTFASMLPSRFRDMRFGAEDLWGAFHQVLPF